MATTKKQEMADNGYLPIKEAAKYAVLGDATYKKIKDKLEQTFLTKEELETKIVQEVTGNDAFLSQYNSILQLAYQHKTSHEASGIQVLAGHPNSAKRRRYADAERFYEFAKEQLKNDTVNALANADDETKSAAIRQMLAAQGLDDETIASTLQTMGL